jgi:hypothetical protein
VAYRGTRGYVCHILHPPHLLQIRRPEKVFDAGNWKTLLN